MMSKSVAQQATEVSLNRSLVDPEHFRSLMATFPAGVAIVTAKEPGGQSRGMTCSAVSSVSAQPPTLLVCLDHSSRTLAALFRTATFALNLLHHQARPVAELFASSTSSSVDRFSQVRWTWEPFFGGPHLVDNAHTIADCRVVKTVIIGDHTVVFGEVFAVSTSPSHPPSPLLYGLRRYWCLNRKTETTGTADADDRRLLRKEGSK